jgi:hypothetical protein
MSGRFTVFPYLLLDEALAKDVARVKGLRASEEPTTDAPGRTNE